jgi:hypothetical protein
MLRQRNCDGEMLRMDAEDIAAQEAFPANPPRGRATA